MNLDALAEQFRIDGVVLIPGFYDVRAQIDPIRDGIRSIIRLIAGKYGVDAPSASPEEAMTIGYTSLIRANRAYGGEIYDAVKQIPAFMALVSDRRNVDLFSRLRPGSEAGIAAGGYGIRIDNPGEEKYRAQWHQEFPAQLRSLDGVVFWSPLLPVTQATGPVQVCPGSHREGLIAVREHSQGANKTGAYSLVLDKEEERIARYAPIAPETKPGDLLLMDFLTIHQSGYNTSAHPRWSMQFRYFNFVEPTGIRIGWKGSFAAGVRYADVLPELVAQSPGDEPLPDLRGTS